MADMPDSQLFHGNFLCPPARDVPAGESSYPHKPLAEECSELTVADLRRTFGRKALIAAANEARPLRFWMGAQRYDLYVLVEMMRLPIRGCRSSDGEVLRVWLSCPRCRTRRRKLFVPPGETGPSRSYTMSCRACLQLKYLSSRSWNRVWYRDLVLPLRQLLRERRQLLDRARHSAKVKARLDEIDVVTFALKNRACCRNRTGRRRQRVAAPAVRRRYRNLAHVCGFSRQKRAKNRKNPHKH